MVAYFPQLANGVRAHYPYKVESSFLNAVVDLPNGGRSSYSYRTNPLSKFSVTYSSLPDTSVGILEAFFLAQLGKWGQWAWLDPAGNLLPNSASYADGSTDVFGTGAGGHASSLSQQILPSDAAGITLTSSIYVFPSSTSTYSIGINSDVASVTAHGGAWTRLQHTSVCSGSGTQTATVSGPNSLFCGWMVAPLPAAGFYVSTPGVGYGLHLACRFDTDEIKIDYKGPGESSVTLSVVDVGS